MPLPAYEKVALVTGAGRRRVGQAVARALAGRGYAIAIHYHRSAAEAEPLMRRGDETGYFRLRHARPDERIRGGVGCERDLVGEPHQVDLVLRLDHAAACDNRGRRGHFGCGGRLGGVSRHEFFLA